MSFYVVTVKNPMGHEREIGPIHARSEAEAKRTAFSVAQANVRRGEHEPGYAETWNRQNVLNLIEQGALDARAGRFDSALQMLHNAENYWKVERAREL